MHLQQGVFFDYDEADLQALAVQPSLQEIQLKVAPELETLEGIADLPTVAGLRIAAARELRTLTAIESTAATLRSLDFESCLDIYDIHPLSALTELRYLRHQRLRVGNPVAPPNRRAGNARLSLCLGKHPDRGRRPLPTVETEEVTLRSWSSAV